MNINILYEDNDIIICVKPPGVPTQSDKTSDYDMVNQLKNYIYEKHPDKGQPYVGLLHRLDRPVGGILLFAKTPYAAKELSEQIRLKNITKKYLAVTTSDLTKEIGKDKVLLKDYLVKDGRTNLSKISSVKDKNAKLAELYYKVLKVITIEVDSSGASDASDATDFKKFTTLSMIEIELLTGRHHQIRVQMTSKGNPLWGDTKYNLQFSNPESLKQYSTKHNDWVNVALYAYQLEFTHPRTKKSMKFQMLPKVEPFLSFEKI